MNNCKHIGIIYWELNKPRILCSLCHRFVGVEFEEIEKGWIKL